MDHRSAFFYPFLLAVVLAVSFLACAEKENDDENDGDDDSSPPCEPTCWQHSPEQATGSLGQAELGANICKNADSGCPDRYCVATRLEFHDAPEDLLYSIQCKSGFISEEVNDQFCSHYSTGGSTWDNLWLGPDYGMLAPNKNGFVCNTVAYSA